ncbi:sensor histidine kinase KdpD [Cupriavidus sp. L7L]|uniref:sensor histidine kinase n=1 Tax=Cupriavidus sp. L7L TaxID=2546443 RepID=UPI0010567CA3|nr:HAMP domain-containing histidine kinase [Cupriavidus sp. L7L]TDF64246.1 HAMP domain-containing histidine kinase [Cupriavidus sp. L7L]
MTQPQPPSNLPDVSDDQATDVAAGADTAETAAVRAVQEVSTLIEQSAHDLRSSLNAIQSWAYVLDRAFDAAPAPAQRALDGIRAGTQQQLALIEEMEESVRLLADERPPSWQRIDLLDAAAQAIADRRPAAEARGVLLAPVTTDGAGDGGYGIDGDANRLVPLLRHLLVHCIWRAPAGGSVAMHLFGEPAHVKLRIAESPPLDQQRSASRLAALTDFFGRRAAPDGGSQARQSTALLLTRRMVEMHGALLSAEGDGCDADKISVCIAVRFPRQPRTA